MPFLLILSPPTIAHLIEGDQGLRTIPHVDTMHLDLISKLGPAGSIPIPSFNIYISIMFPKYFRIFVYVCLFLCVYLYETTI